MDKVLVIPLSDPVPKKYLYFASIASLTFIERLCWLAKKAGYKNSVIIDTKNYEGLKKALSRAPGQIAHSLKESSVDNNSTFIFLRPDIFPTIDFLKTISAPDKKDTLYLEEGNSPVMVIQPSDIAKLSEILNGQTETISLQETLSKSYSVDTLSLGSDKFYEITDHDDISHVEKKLYLGLIKETESFMSRHVERKISLAITRLLINTSVTPNQMSVISIGIGIVGGFFLSFPATSFQTFGALLFLSHSILDGCDGEIARLKYLESRWGGLLDFWGDNVVHSAVFLGIGLAWKKAAGSSIALWCSGLAITGALLTAGLVYVMTMRPKKDEGPMYTSISRKEEKDRWVKIADYLSRRDFIYLVVLLAALGKAHWFLIMAAVGAPIFFLFTLRANLK